MGGSFNYASRSTSTFFELREKGAPWGSTMFARKQGTAYSLLMHKLVCLAPFFLMGCDKAIWDRPPNETVINEIEEKIKTVPCVGALNEWERNYGIAYEPSFTADLLSFGASPGWPDYNTVDIMYRQAGIYDFKAGRIPKEHILSGIDDREYDLVHGYYNIKQKTITIDYCGSTFADEDSHENTGKFPIIVR